MLWVHDGQVCFGIGTTSVTSALSTCADAMACFAHCCAAIDCALIARDHMPSLGTGDTFKSTGLSYHNKPGSYTTQIAASLPAVLNKLDALCIADGRHVRCNK